MISPINNNRFGVAMLQRQLARLPALVPVFDLDGVLLDASHRITLKPCGALDLDKYRKDTTAENIQLDRDLPMVDLVHWLNQQKRPYYVATARVACEHTRARLEASYIRPAGIMARLGHDDRRGDAVLKADHFMAGFTDRERERLILLDDLRSNCEAALGCGMLAHQIITEYNTPLVIA